MVVQFTVYRTCSGLPVLVVPVSFEIPRVVREVKVKLSAIQRYIKAPLGRCPLGHQL